MRVDWPLRSAPFRSGRIEPLWLLVSPLLSEDEEPSQPTGTNGGPLIAAPFLHVSWPQRLSPLASIPAISRITDADSVTVLAKLYLFSSYAFAPRHLQT